MNAISANEAKTHFGELLLHAQQSPIQINKNGKPVAVMVSTEEFQNMETLKLHFLQSRAIQANEDMRVDNHIDGSEFFKQLQSGQYD